MMLLNAPGYLNYFFGSYGIQQFGLLRKIDNTSAFLIFQYQCNVPFFSSLPSESYLIMRQ